MDESNENQPYELKRAKLDELFADEPFLSPTMKARRLHEKLNGFGNGNGGHANRADSLPTEAWVQSAPVRPEAERKILRVEQEPRNVAPSASVQPVSLSEAAAFLRSTRGIGREPNIDPWSASRLLALRDGPLTAWLRELG